MCVQCLCRCLEHYAHIVSYVYTYIRECTLNCTDCTLTSYLSVKGHHTWQPVMYICTYKHIPLLPGLPRGLFGSRVRF